MSADAKTFSESWYRIADGRVALRPHVQVRRQFFRGERFYVLHDPLNNHFFRLRPAAHAFVARLAMSRTIDEVWRECMEADPDEAPGQEDVLKLLGQLHAASLLHTQLPPDSVKMFERQKKRTQREVRMTLLNAMFARFPLVDPDRLLKAALPLLRVIVSPLGALVWLGVIGAAIKVLVDHAGALRDQSQSLLAPDNLVLLTCALAVLKLLHEFGHAGMCRRFGGEVHVMGIMLMVFVPMPYVDTTSSWGFRSRAQRVLVGAAGMIVELFVAALAVFVWAATGPGALHSLAYNLLFVASVSTLLFNANPLLRFDGYYILSDLIEIPNLQTRATKQVLYLVERFLFGVKAAHTLAPTARESAWLCIYGVSSTAYRIFISAAILLVVADEYLILGLLALVVGLISWVVLPLWKGVHYLAASPRLARTRPRALAVVGGALALAVIALQFVPAPSHFRAPGVLEAVEHSAVAAQAPGRLRDILAATGSDVAQGQPLIAMENPELEFELAGARAEIAEALALRARALEEGAADLEPIDSRIEVIEKRLARLREQAAALTVRAPHAGRWVAPALEMYRESWAARGTELGQVVNPEAFHFSAVVSQEEASRLFGQEIRGAQVRLAGQAALALRVSGQRIIPAERQTLPSAALGWAAGGDIAIAPDDATGLRAEERFFEVRARVEPPPGVALIHGRSGRIRFELPSEPLLSQWMRKLRQLLQKRGVS